MHLRVAAFDIVRVVGGDDFHPNLGGEAHEVGIDALLLFHAVILKFDIKIALVEHAFEFERVFFRPFVITREQQLRDLSRQTGGKADKPLRMLFEQFEIYPRLIVESLRIGERIQLDEVIISFVVFGEQNEMVALLVMHVHVFASVKLAADDGLYAVLYRHLLESIGGEHIAVVGDRHGAHAHVPDRVEERAFLSRHEARRAVEKGIFRVDMQMHEAFDDVGNGRIFRLFLLFFRSLLRVFFAFLLFFAFFFLRFFLHFFLLRLLRHFTSPFALPYR